jgi:hypothetical protein
MTDHADNAAAVAAGYVRVQLDRGAGKSPRYISRYEKSLTGAAGDSGHLLKAEASSDASQAAADTVALNALNGQRKLRYGAAATAGKDGRGSTQTFDLT